MKNDENYEGLYNYQPSEIPKEHKQVVLEVLKHLESREGVSYDIIKTELLQKFNIEDVPMLDLKDTLWYHLTKDIKEANGIIQGFRYKVLENGKKIKVPYISFTLDLEKLNELLLHIIEKGKNIKIGN
jgi:hypothetical protein